MLRYYLSARHLSCMRVLRKQVAFSKKFSTAEQCEGNSYEGYGLCVGIEIHAQISSKTKLFSTASTGFELEKPNRLVAFFDAAVPGTMPRLNKYCVEQAIKTGLALGGKINKRSMFERKHYFYPDMPQGYQVTQQRMPIVSGGRVKIEVPKSRDNSKRFDVYTKDVGITRIQLEQDSGKSIRDVDPSKIFIDLNRAGCGLMEIVSDPDMRSSYEAGAFVRKVQTILKHIGTCDGNMEEGNMRCDVNISIFRKPNPVLGDGDTTLMHGHRVEIKNMNSIKGVQSAIDFEYKRQVELAMNGTPIEMHETRGYDANTGKTLKMRRKEVAADYRFMPEPDLLPLCVDEESIIRLKAEMPELPDELRLRLESQYGLSVYESGVLMEEEGATSFFENTVTRLMHERAKTGLQRAEVARTVWNWLANDVFGRLKHADIALGESSSGPLSEEYFVQFIGLLIDKQISTKTGKDVLDLIFRTNDNNEFAFQSPQKIVELNQWAQISDIEVIKKLCQDVVHSSENAKQLDDYLSGKKPKLFGFFVGKALKKSGGKANPIVVNNVLKDILDDI
eukprot:g4091.t1